MDVQRDDIGLRQGVTFQGAIAGLALITAACVLLAACVAFISLQWEQDRRALSKHHQTMAAILAEHARDDILNGRRDELPWLVGTLAKAPDVRTAFYRDPQGRVMHGEALEAADLHAAEQDGLVITAPLSPGARPGLGEIVVVSDPANLVLLAARYIAVCAMLFFAATGLAMFLSRWLAGRLIRPVDELSRWMRDLAASGDVTRRAPRVADDVFGRLTDSFNALMDKLQDGDQALRHSNQELLVARDAAETANVLKSQFLANMSHEIRTPLNGVLAMAQVMEMSALAAEQRERLVVIRHSAEALLAVLNDVLDLSKIEAGRLELETAEFDVESVTRSVASTFAPLALAKHLQFEVDFAPSAAGLRRGDPGRLRQIIGNLLSNAVKFTSAGSVRLTLEGLGPDGAEGLTIRVQDTGIGIPPENRARLFEKFTQVDSSATRRFGGTGLGLAICRELASLMGGGISVESAIGLGSTFTVELPLARTGAAVPQLSPAELTTASTGQLPEPQPPAVGADAVRVLAAEDNLTNQRVLRAVLDTFGVDLTVVDNGRKAVEAWQDGAFDVILMDIQMPEMDGVEATRRIREAERETGRSRTPILALSANAMTHQVSEYLEAGMDAHVAKPIEIPKLQAALEAALESGEANRAAAAA
jgi:signal transduction histidine kinase/AmiR/NasT family two-component response regulator